MATCLFNLQASARNRSNVRPASGLCDLHVFRLTAQLDAELSIVVCGGHQGAQFIDSRSIELHKPRNRIGRIVPVADVGNLATFLATERFPVQFRGFGWQMIRSIRVRKHHLRAHRHGLEPGALDAQRGGQRGNRRCGQCDFEAIFGLLPAEITIVA